MSCVGQGLRVVAPVNCHVGERPSRTGGRNDLAGKSPT